MINVDKPKTKVYFNEINKNEEKIKNKWGKKDDTKYFKYILFYILDEKKLIIDLNV